MGKIFSRLISIVGLLVLLYSGLFFTSDLVKLKAWIGSGQNGLSLRAGGPNGPWEITDVDDALFKNPPHLPVVGDTLVTIIDAAGDTTTVRELASRVNLPGVEITLSYHHEGEAEQAVLIYQERPVSQLVLNIVLELFRLLITMGFLAVGLWALSKRPDNPGVRALDLFSFAMSALMLSAVQLGFHRLPAFEIPGDAPY